MEEAGGSLMIAGAGCSGIGGGCSVAGDLHKMEKALRGAFLDIRSSNEFTIHPANGLLMHALQSFSGNTYMLQSILANGDYTTEPYCRLLQCWASELEKDAEMMCQGEKGRKYIFLMNNIYDVLQMIRRQGATFANVELVSKLNSLIQRYKKSYFDQCWVPLTSTCRLNLDKFTAEFLATCDNQRTWKVTAQLRYELRQEIVDLTVPLYELSLSALHANQSWFSAVLCSFKRVTAGKKKQKRYTGEELAQKIRGLFEG
ncbi:hypothetical protein ACQ4PT_043572 [Festuca glaucescens]